jgi:hypothetical protein
LNHSANRLPTQQNFGHLLRIGRDLSSYAYIFRRFAAWVNRDAGHNLNLGRHVIALELAHSDSFPRLCAAFRLSYNEFCREGDLLARNAAIAAGLVSQASA